MVEYSSIFIVFTWMIVRVDLLTWVLIMLSMIFFMFLMGWDLVCSISRVVVVSQYSILLSSIWVWVIGEIWFSNER